MPDMERRWGVAAEESSSSGQIELEKSLAKLFSVS
jgi:hypothetical protein